MTVLVFESNLFWSARLTKALAALGHEAHVVPPGKDDFEAAEVALVNLGEAAYGPGELVPRLRDLGVYVIGHAGHKETELRELGKAAGCDRIASNSELTFKLEALIGEAVAEKGPSP